MHICLFEDESVLNFEPLTYSRPVYELVCGASTLKDKILKAFPGVMYSLFCRDYLKAITEQANPGVSVNKIDHDQCVFINGRIIATEEFTPIASELISYKGNDKVFRKGNFIAATVLSGKNLKYVSTSGTFSDLLNTLPSEEIEVIYADYIWDLIYANKSEITREITSFLKSSTAAAKSNSSDGVWYLEKDNIFIDEGTKIKPGVVIDASNGPVYIGKNSVVYPNAVIEGPVYIGNSTLIKTISKIYVGVSIGSVCKVGGEVEDSIVMSYSNKQHEGFLGHAYLGNWVNLGADTNCSDLRNNYGPVKVYLNGKDLNTGKQFLGLIMGDHSKTGINSMFNTGTIAGFSCNIYGAGFPDKYIPSFGWGGEVNQW